MSESRHVAVVAVLGLVLLAGFVWRPAGNEQSPPDEPLSIASPPLIDPHSLATLLPRDSIPAIDDPQFEAAARAENMGAGERVIGLEINGDARAYPINILSSHEIVNDVVGGQAVAVTWCPLCYSALVFSRQVDDQELSFGVSGRLLQNTLVMYDRQTESLWSQLYGGAINGPLAGSSLKVFPSVLTEWESWRSLHPHGRVLSKRQTCATFSCGDYASNPRGSYELDPYAGYYITADEGVVNRQIPRDEAAGAPKQRVLGVRLGEFARAYPFAILAQERVINDEIDGVPVVIWFDPQAESGAAFLRQVDDLVLTFQPDLDDPAAMRDSRSNSLWSGVSGEAKSGSFEHSRLSPLVTTPAFEFGWYGYFPSSDTYGGI